MITTKPLSCFGGAAIAAAIFMGQHPQATFASHMDPPIEPVPCATGFYYPECNMQAASVVPKVMYSPLNETEKECVDDGTTTTCRLDMETFLFTLPTDDYLLKTSISCPTESIVDDFGGDFVTASRNQGLCDCSMSIQSIQFDLPPYSFSGCQCHACPEGSISSFAATCPEEIQWGCTSWTCDGSCNEPLDWISDVPRPPEFGPDPTVDCVQTSLSDNDNDEERCIANGLSDPVLVFTQFEANRPCFIGDGTTRLEEIICPAEMKLSLQDSDADSSDQVYTLAADISCETVFSIDYDFRQASLVKDLCESTTTLTAPDGTITSPTCTWHVCPEDYFSPLAVTCDTELIGPCTGFSCNGVCNGVLEYSPDPRFGANQDLLFENPLSEAEEEKVTVGDIVQWSADMLVTTINAEQDETFYIDGRFECPVNDEVEEDGDWFDYTRTHANGCGCVAHVYPADGSSTPPDNQPGLGPLPDDTPATGGRRLENCLCHTCQNGDWEAGFALMCESDIVVGSVGGCKSINCRGECDADLFFFPSTPPTLSPTMKPTVEQQVTPYPSNEPSLSPTTPYPSMSPSLPPSLSPSPLPTSGPTKIDVSSSPSLSLWNQPTGIPSTITPTNIPTTLNELPPSQSDQPSISPTVILGNAISTAPSNLPIEETTPPEPTPSPITTPTGGTPTGTTPTESEPTGGTPTEATPTTPGTPDASPAPSSEPVDEPSSACKASLGGVGAILMLYLSFWVI